MTRHYEPSPVQLCLALDAPKPLTAIDFKANSEVPLKSMVCNAPVMRLGQDQYRCRKCSVVWDIDEARPPCQDTTLEEPHT